MKLIQDKEELAKICARMAQYPYVTVDTEFLRETTFWPKMCVIQMASPEEAIAIDALIPVYDLAPFFDLMRNSSIMKVFHAARQDLESIWHIAHFLPTPLFDTQIAAMACGYGDQVSYGELVQSICHISLDKSSRFTDWSRRPLLETQIKYALADVIWLRDIYQHLHSQLREKNRESWLKEEMDALLAPEAYHQAPELAWKRFKHRIRKKKDFAILREIAAWREQEAQTRNVPRSRILKDDMLLEIASIAPSNMAALAHLRNCPKDLSHSPLGQSLIEAIQRGLAQDLHLLPDLLPPKPKSGHAAVVELLRVLLWHIGGLEKVAPRLLASTEDLDAIALHGENAQIPALSGWRYEIFGKKALALVQGKLGLTLEGKNMKLYESDTILS